MARLVMKFGGTSMADLERIYNVARHVKREHDAGHEVALQLLEHRAHLEVRRDGRDGRAHPGGADRLADVGATHHNIEHLRRSIARRRQHHQPIRIGRRTFS